jgi:hypothetical protein
MLEWGGINFGDDFAFKLSKSIKVSSSRLTCRNLQSSVEPVPCAFSERFLERRRTTGLFTALWATLKNLT